MNKVQVYLEANSAIFELSPVSQHESRLNLEETDIFASYAPHIHVSDTRSLQLGSNLIRHVVSQTITVIS